MKFSTKLGMVFIVAVLAACGSENNDDSNNGTNNGNTSTGTSNNGTTTNTSNNGTSLCPAGEIELSAGTCAKSCVSHSECQASDLCIGALKQEHGCSSTFIAEAEAAKKLWEGANITNYSYVAESVPEGSLETYTIVDGKIVKIEDESMNEVPLTAENMNNTIKAMFLLPAFAKLDSSSNITMEFDEKDGHPTILLRNDKGFKVTNLKSK